MIYLVCLLTGLLCLTCLMIHDTLNMHMCNYVGFFIIFILIILLFKICDTDMVIICLVNIIKISCYTIETIYG